MQTVCKQKNTASVLTLFLNTKWFVESQDVGKGLLWQFCILSAKIAFIVLTLKIVYLSTYGKNVVIKIVIFGRGGGQVVSVLVFYPDNPSSNPAEAFSFL